MDVSSDLEEEPGSWNLVEPADVFQTDMPSNISAELIDGQHEFYDPGTEYEPSLRSDFSALLPTVSDVTTEELTDYKPDVVVQSAWQTLNNKELELPWEGGFWDKFLDPNIPAIDLFSRGIKRPMPFYAEPSQSSAASSEVSKRAVGRQVEQVTGFLQHIRDVPIRTWREEREAV